MKVNELAYKPKCPQCKEIANFDVVIDEYTVGANGQYELVVCSSCHCVVACNPIEVSILK